MLSSVRGRMDSQIVTDRPLGIMYCHKAGHRVIVERIKELVTIPHQRMIPVYLVLTDVYAIDDEALAEFRGVFRELVREVSPLLLCHVKYNPVFLFSHWHWRFYLISLSLSLCIHNCLYRLDSIQEVRASTSWKWTLSRKRWGDESLDRLVCLNSLPRYWTLWNPWIYWHSLRELSLVLEHINIQKREKENRFKKECTLSYW